MQPQQPYSPQPPQQPAPQPQPFQQPQYSIDYLNQIAPQSHRPTPKWQRFAILGVIIVGVIVLLMGIVTILGGSSPAKLPTMAARLQTLQKIVDAAQPQIKANTLRVTNSNLSLYLVDANRDMVAPLKANNVDPAKLDKTVLKKEDGSALTATLEDARLNAVYDRTYAREMNYQLTTFLLLMKDIRASSSSRSLDTFIDTTSANLKTSQEQFASYSDSTN
jgi:hypothetical protein